MSTEITTLQGQALTANPFGNAGTSSAPVPTGGNALMTAETQRAIAEIQASAVIAMHNPRNPQLAMDRILVECQRPSLAETAIYSYPKGGVTVTGASIRLAEVLKRHWQHIRSGWRCLERAKGRSLLEAYAYDIQNNVAENRTFEVYHIRNTKKGNFPITDERDLYELEANQAARRVRACILSLIDGDVVEAALDQCSRTLQAEVNLTPDTIKKMIDAFKVYNVNQAMLEARIGRNISAITAAQVVSLRGILTGMRDGISTPAHWFDLKLAEVTEEPEGAEEKKSTAATTAIKEKVKAKAAVPAPAKTGLTDPPLERAGYAILQAIEAEKTRDGLDRIMNQNDAELQEIKSLDPDRFNEIEGKFLDRYDSLRPDAVVEGDQSKPNQETFHAQPETTGTLI